MMISFSHFRSINTRICTYTWKKLKMDTVKVNSRFWVMPSSYDPKLNSSLPSKENNMLSIILPKLHDFKINIKGLSKET